MLEGNRTLNGITAIYLMRSIPLSLRNNKLKSLFMSQLHQMVKRHKRAKACSRPKPPVFCVLQEMQSEKLHHKLEDHESHARNKATKDAKVRSIVVVPSL